MRARSEYRRCYVCHKVQKHTVFRIIGRRVDGSWLTVAVLCRPCQRGVIDMLQTVRAEYQ